MLGGAAPETSSDPLHSLRLTVDSGPDAIGNPNYTTLGGMRGFRLFLKAGGWTSARFSDSDLWALDAGDESYVQSIYAEAFHALNPSAMRIFPATANFPDVIPKSPYLMAEALMGSDLINNSLTTSADFGSETLRMISPLLEEYLVINYYLFYPVLMPPAAIFSTALPNNRVLLREGQWQAISLFFKADAIERLSPSSPPTILHFDQVIEPRYAAYSQGYDIVNMNPDEGLAEVRQWADVLKHDGNHPVVYISAGTHKNFFTPLNTVITGGSPAGKRLGTGGDALRSIGVGIITYGAYPVWGAAGAVALLSLMVGPFTLPLLVSGPPGAIGVILVNASLWSLAWILFLIGLIIAVIGGILWLIGTAINEATATSTPAEPVRVIAMRDAATTRGRNRNRSSGCSLRFISHIGRSGRTVPDYQYIIRAEHQYCFECGGR